MEHLIVEGYAVKLVPSGASADKCDYGLPVFALNRVEAVNECVRMLNHFNVRLSGAIIRYIGRYDVTAGVLIAPVECDFWESDLSSALDDLLKKEEGDGSHEAQK